MTDNNMVNRKRTKRKNNDLQNITKKSRDQVTGITLKSGGELWCDKVYADLAPCVPPVVLLLLQLGDKS